MFRRYPNKLFRLICLSVALGHGVALQARPPSGQTPINLQQDIVYKTTAEGDLKMDLYYPASELVGAYPLVIYTHGGGWAAGSKEKAQVMSHMGAVVRGLTEAGFCVAAVNYRLCNKGDTRIRDCVTDAMDAVRYLAKHGEKLHVDPTRVFTFGDSAGGQLAQMLLLAPTNAFPGAAELADQRYTMVAGVSWYGPCDFEKTELFNPDGRKNFRDRFGMRLLKPETGPSDQLRFYREVSPINYLRKDGPPLLMIQGDKDTTIPVHHAYYMQEKAKACSAPVKILIVKNAGHNWRQVDAPIEPSLNDIVKRTVDFLVADNISSHAEAVMIVAHRGASRDAPQNTVPAFKLAWEQGADAIEGDFRLTKDGHVVCIHDGNTEKVATTNLVVHESTLAELRPLDVGVRHAEAFKGTGIPTMAEVLATVPEGKRIYIEVKCGAEIIPSLLEEIKASGLKPEQIAVISFNHEVIQEFKAKASQYKAFLLCSFNEQKNGQIMPPLARVMRTLKQVRADGLFSSTNVPLPVIEAVRQQGYEWHAWTINDLTEARRMTGLGAQSIITDLPGYMKKHLSAKKTEITPTLRHPLK